MEKITIPEALTTALIGISVVMLILAIIAVFIIMISKIIRFVETKTSAIKKAPVSAEPASGSPATAPSNEVELINTDEKTAAVIMAIVSQQTDIPVNRLSFKSIRLIEENEKGGKA